MGDYDYDKFLEDSSDDYPKYADGIEQKLLYIKQEDDDWACRDAYDHSEERTRDEIGFEQDDIELNEKDFLLAFQEVIRLSRCAVQSWWTEEYRAKSESKIELIQKYLNKLKNKS
jgi:hypothetical protein